jgi:hypothetical protein
VAVSLNADGTDGAVLFSHTLSSLPEQHVTIDAKQMPAPAPTACAEAEHLGRDARLEELEAAVQAALAAVQAAREAIAWVVENAPRTCRCSRLRVWNMIADATPESTYPV